MESKARLTRPFLFIPVFLSRMFCSPEFYLFILVSCISFYHVSQSISVTKYLLYMGMTDMVNSYYLYHHSFRDFFFQTGVFHPGNSESGWRTFFYLYPLFVYCDLLGGLSFERLYYFTIISSLCALILFYWWVRRIAGREAAWWMFYFFGLSSIFQEFARSGSYDIFSLLVAIAWIMYFFQFLNEEKPFREYLIFGLLTGGVWFYYGMLRTFFLAVLVHILFTKDKRRNAFFFLSGMGLVIAPSIGLLMWQHSAGANAYIDRENIFNVVNHHLSDFLMVIHNNVIIFLNRMFGEYDHIEMIHLDRIHAHFHHPLLSIPLIVGICVTLRRKTTQLPFLVLIFLIYLTPMMTSSWGFYEARRSVLCLIPNYFFIGIGMKEIFLEVQRVFNRHLRRLLFSIIFGCIFIICYQEVSFFKTHILNATRDPGLLKLSDDIKKNHFSGKLLYLEEKTYYLDTPGSDMLRISLLQNGKCIPDVVGLELADVVPKGLNQFYIVISPEISQKVFLKWCIENKIDPGKIVYQEPLVNMPNAMNKGAFFRLYNAKIK